MTKEREALKLAVDRLEWFVDAYPHDITVNEDEFLRPFKEALAQPEQEHFDGCVMVGYSKSSDAYFVYEETASKEFCAIKGPFVTREDAEHAMRDPNAPLIEQPKEPEQEPVKLWLWKNFVNGRPEYWAFDNAFPINMNDGDPQTLGEPCGYAWLKPSRQGRFDVSDEEVLRAIQNAKEYPPQRKPLTDEQIAEITAQGSQRWIDFARAIEAAHGIKE